MPTKTHGKATLTLCPGARGKDGLYYHDLRDGCSSCAPFWLYIPMCPVDSKSLTETGYCKTCGKHYEFRPETDAERKAARLAAGYSA